MEFAPDEKYPGHAPVNSHLLSIYDYLFRVIIPLSSTANPQLIWQPQISGILGVKLKAVKNLPR